MAGLCLLALLLPGCRNGSEPTEADATLPLWLDSAVATPDAGSPFTEFDGRGGSLLPGPGFAPPEGDGSGGEWGDYAWANAREATFWFAPPPAGEMDLYARCHPFPFGELDPPQVLRVVWQGREVASHQLSEGWQDVRLSLPIPPGTRGIQEVVLQFDRVTKPSDVGESGDQRTLAAAFSTLGIVPRSVADPLVFLESARLSARDRELMLPVGGAFALALPASNHGRVRFGAVESSCTGCRIQVEVATARGEATRLYQGTVAGLADTTVELTTPQDGLSRLVVRALPASSPSRSVRTISFTLPDDFLRLEPSSSATPGEKPHVFVYLVDTLRADALAPYGGRAEVAPAMTAFGKDGVVYRNARTASSWTLPSVVSILTGAYPFLHHVMRGNIRFDSEALPGMGRLLADAGYRTVGISQSFVASEAFGIDGDFEEFFLNDQLNGRELRSPLARSFLVQWLYHSRPDDAPVFAYLHTVDPHAPYAPPAAYRHLAESAPGELAPERYSPSVFMKEGLAERTAEVAHLEALYMGEVQFADAEFGRFVLTLRHLGLYDSSLVILLSDHGEEFAEHGGFDHGRTLYEEQLQVPLLVKYPGGRGAGSTSDLPVSTVDILPTVLSVAGAGTAGLSRHGVDLASFLAPEEASGRRGIFAQVNPAPGPHAGEVDLRALSVDDLKCIQNLDGVDQFGAPAPEWSVFDLSRDPEEHFPLDPGTTDERRCREAMVRWLEASASDAGSQGDATSEQAIEQLRALGYIE